MEEGRYIPMPSFYPAFMTKTLLGDIVSGIIFTVATMVALLGFIAVPFLFFVWREKYPIFAKTIGITWCITLLIILALILMPVYSYCI